MKKPTHENNRKKTTRKRTKTVKIESRQFNTAPSFGWSRICRVESNVCLSVWGESEIDLPCWNVSNGELRMNNYHGVLWQTVFFVFCFVFLKTDCQVSFRWMFHVDRLIMKWWPTVMCTVGTFQLLLCVSECLTLSLSVTLCNSL